jgi:hypothetical protein
MYMRIIRGEFKPGTVDEFARRWHKEVVPKYHQIPGVRHVYLGVDHEKNTVASAAIFETRPDEEAINRFVREFVGHIQDLIVSGPHIEHFDIVEDVT